MVFKSQNFRKTSNLEKGRDIQELIVSRNIKRNGILCEKLRNSLESFSLKNISLGVGRDCGEYETAQLLHAHNDNQELGVEISDRLFAYFLGLATLTSTNRDL